MYVCMHVLCVLRVQKRVLDPQELKLHIVLNPYMNARYQLWVPWESSKFS